LIKAQWQNCQNCRCWLIAAGEVNVLERNLQEQSEKYL